MESNSVARQLLNIGAVQIRPNDLFTWTSGIRSPIYCDNRLVMSYPKVREQIIDAFVTHIKSLEERVDMIAGCATAGIPHAAWVADRLGLPMVYVRGEAKKHGKGNQIEGDLTQGEYIVVIEDLISTGKSSIAASDAVINSGKSVVEVLSIFTYNLAEASEAFAAKGLRTHSLAAYNELISIMKQAGEISDEEYSKLQQWREEPKIFTEA
ncbi:orotate phosphoribosyltransferase [Halobacillus sp. Marseille-Q1614]|uniref:orotate phosphoribosyltransferase n=1 Tax=Halobacillus sp. Marseille-Q1614 TaxID=2709134 RepID=UPI00156F666F|nr:orotate phosphoribosyltransferase [Halobacillus sp. Marseille-Q1614]